MMNTTDFAYAIFLGCSMVCFYAISLAFFPRFFGQQIKFPAYFRTSFSIISIMILFCTFYIAAYLVPDLFVGNRILHAFAGGFTAFFACYLAARDSDARMNAFQFFFLGTLIVTALGVANELVEFFLQQFFGYAAALTVTDTWFDLASNMVGTLVGGICFTYFYVRHNATH